MPFSVSFYLNFLFLFVKSATTAWPSNVSAPVRMASSPDTSAAPGLHTTVFIGHLEVGSDQSPFLFQTCCLLLVRIPNLSPCICRSGAP